MPTFLQELPLLTIIGSGSITVQAIAAENIYVLDVKQLIIGGEISSVSASAFGSFSNLKNVSITSNSFVSIDDNAFHDLGISVVDFGSSIQTIKAQSFISCKGIKSIVFPASLTSIGNRAFWNSGLVTISFAEGSILKEIKYEAFKYCYGLTTLVLPDSLEIIGENAFQHAPIASFRFGPNVASISNSTLGFCRKLIEVSVDAGNAAFYAQANIVYVKSSNKLIQAPCGVSGTCTIPYFVTELHHYAFQGSSFTEVVFGAGVKVVGCYCFASSSVKQVALNPTLETLKLGCFQSSGLTSFHIPLSIVAIEEGSFSGCTQLGSLTKDDENTKFEVHDNILYSQHCGFIIFCPFALTNVIIHENITSIPQNAFFGYTNIQRIAFPARLNYIGVSAFSRCSGLGEITFPASLARIAGAAFQSCTSLTSITFPDQNSLLSLDWSSFEYCSSLKNVVFGKDPIPASFSLVSNVFHQTSLERIELPPNLVTLGPGTFLECPELAEITISYASLTMGESIFKGCLALARISLDVPAAVENSFREIPGLETLSLGSRIKEIKDNAFFQCSSLVAVNFNGITGLTIGTLAFSQCAMLGPSITLPPQMAGLHSDCFAYCTSLTEILTADNLRYVSDGGILYSPDLRTLVLCPSGKDTVTTNAKIEVIGPKSFYGCSLLNSVVFGANISTISDYCFYGCSNLIEVNIPVSVRFFGNRPFMNCNKLETLYYCSVTENITCLSPKPIEENVMIVVRYDFQGETLLEHPVIKSTSIKNDQCPLKPSKLFTTKKQKQLKKKTLNICLLIFTFMGNNYR